VRAAIPPFNFPAAARRAATPSGMRRPGTMPPEETWLSPLEIVDGGAIVGYCRGRDAQLLGCGLLRWRMWFYLTRGTVGRWEDPMR
jgi:hypothetical protein